MKATHLSPTKPLVILGILASLQGFVKSESKSNCDDNSKLKYEAGKSYVYTLEQITYDTSKDDWSDSDRRDQLWHTRTRGKITTSGNVILTALENCNFAVTLQDVVIDVTGERVGEFKDSRNGSVPRTSMLFTFRNGEVSNLFKQEGEASIWTENLLRGILTMIQNKGLGNSEGEQEEKETNIKGECLSRIYIPDENTYQKTILAGKCSDPVITPSEGVPYNTHGYGRPHFRHDHSHVRCQNNVTNGLLTSMSCTESSVLRHLYILLNHRSEMTTTLTLRPESEAVFNSDEVLALTEATSIKYDSRQSHADSSWEEDVLAEALTITKAMFEDSNQNRAELYLRLKEILVFVKDFQKLEQMIQSECSADGTDPMKFQFLVNMVRNVATEIGTEGAVVYISSLIHNKALSKGAVAVFHTHLYQTKDATLEGIKALDVIIQDTLDEFNQGGILDTINIFGGKKRVIRQQLLGVSAYAYQFCRRSPNCGELPEYLGLIGKIAQFATSKLPDITHAALQSLGNVPSLPESAVKIVQEIFEQDGSILNGGEAKMLSAFDSFRRDPCQQTLKQLSRNMLTDTKKSLEVRITAYMAIARCLDNDDLKVINNMLENNPESPLSSYIASHVYNIMDSQSPSKLPLKTGLISQISIPESVFTVHNMSQASKFIEHSTFLEKHNVGFSVEASLIFPQDESTTAQFVFANLTIDAFGKSYNKLQVGLSGRLVPSTRSGSKIGSVINFFHVKHNKMLMEIVPMLMAMDSFYRLYGTTITMGVDAIEHIKAHKFFDHKKDPDTEVLKFDFVKAFTMIDHEIRVPTISGLPLTFTTQMAYLPMVSATHTGDTNGVGLKDLITKWDQETGTFAHNSTSDSAVVASLDISIGKGTPAHISNRVLTKAHANHSIGFESVMEDGVWLKTIHFPDMSVASVRMTIIQQFIMDYNGHQFQNWNMFGDMTPREQEVLFNTGDLMGLKASGRVLSWPCARTGQAPVDVVFEIEKTEEEFSGYGLAIELKDEGQFTKKFDLKAMAYGLSTQDTIHIHVNHTQMNVDDIDFDEKPSIWVNVYADMTRKNVNPTGFDLTYKSEGHPKSVLADYPNFSEFEAAGILSPISLGHITRPQYSLQLEIMENGEKNKLLDWTVNNNKDEAKMIMKFTGLLEHQVGEIQSMIARKKLHEGKKTAAHVRSRLPSKHKDTAHGIEYKVEMSQKSRDFGDNKMAINFVHEIWQHIWLNTTVNLQQNTYELTQYIDFPKTHEELDKDSQTTKARSRNTHYKINYKDSNGIKAYSSVNYQEKTNFLENDQMVFIRNASLQVIQGEDAQALFVEATSISEIDNTMQINNHHAGLKRWTKNIYVDAFGKKQAELTIDKKYTETGIDNEQECKMGHKNYVPKDNKPMRCLTSTKKVGLVIADHFEFLSTFSNERRHGFTKVIRAYHTDSEFKFNLTYDLDLPPARKSMGMETKLQVLLENVGESKMDWQHVSSTDLDFENKTLEISSETKKPEKNESPEQVWTLTADGKWEDNSLIVGESQMNIRHTCPENTVTSIDILNRGNVTFERDGDIFKDTLTVTIGSQGRTKILKPKTKFTLDFTTDTRLTEEDKNLYDFGWKWNAQTKMERMTEPQPDEIFKYTESFNFFKVIDQEFWVFKDGQFSLVKEGKESAAGNWDLAFRIIHAEQKESGSINEVSLSTPLSSSPSTHLKLNVNLDAWFEQEEFAQNNTIHLMHSYDLYPYASGVSCVSDFSLKKNDMKNGNEAFKLEVYGMKNVYYKDIFHFSTNEKFNMNIDNRTWAISKDIEVNGPHLKIHILNDGENNDESWLIDFDGGVFEEKHQHKFNFRSKSGYKFDHETNRPTNHLNHYMNKGGIIPYTNFNITVSR